MRRRYLTARMKLGALRSAPYPAAVARLILETVAWFAIHRHRDPDGGLIGDTAARETVVHTLADALAPLARQRRRAVGARSR